jgi:hypothetical protein
MTRRAITTALAAAMLAGASSPAAAAPAAGPQAAFAQAVEALSARLGPAESGPDIEATDAAANAADLAVIEQALDAFGTPAFPVDGLATFDSVCDPLNRLSVRHGLDGITALRRPADAAPPTPAEMQVFTGQLRALQLRNAARHQDAMTVLSTGVLRCMVRHFPALSEFLAGLPEADLTPVRLDGARKMRQGTVQSLLGFMIAMRDPTTTPANRARLRAYLVEVADPLSAALTPDLRTYVSTMIGQLPATTDADALAATDLLKAAMATTACEGLCRY